jgi:hypothetical protein
MVKKIKNGKLKLVKNNDIEFEYDQDIVFNCPVRGTITQKVKIKRIRPQTAPEYTSYDLSLIDIHTEN